MGAMVGAGPARGRTIGTHTHKGPPRRNVSCLDQVEGPQTPNGRRPRPPSSVQPTPPQSSTSYIPFSLSLSLYINIYFFFFLFFLTISSAFSSSFIFNIYFGLRMKEKERKREREREREKWNGGRHQMRRASNVVTEGNGSTVCRSIDPVAAEDATIHRRFNGRRHGRPQGNSMKPKSST